MTFIWYKSLYFCALRLILWWNDWFEISLAIRSDVIVLYHDTTLLINDLSIQTLKNFSKAPRITIFLDYHFTEFYQNSAGYIIKESSLQVLKVAISFHQPVIWELYNHLLPFPEPRQGFIHHVKYTNNNIQMVLRAL